jgi:hypothetical protein
VAGLRVPRLQHETLESMLIVTLRLLWITDCKSILHLYHGTLTLKIMTTVGSPNCRCYNASLSALSENNGYTMRLRGGLASSSDVQIGLQEVLSTSTPDAARQALYHDVGV